MTSALSSLGNPEWGPPLPRHGGRLQANGGELAITNAGDDYTLDGNGNVTRLPVSPAGTRVRLRCTGSPTFINSTLLICPGGANLMPSPGDLVDARSDGNGAWRLYLLPATARPLVLLATGQSNITLTKSLAWSPAPNLHVWNNAVGTTGNIGTAFVAPDPTNTGIAYKWASDVAKANPLRQVFLIVVASSGMSITHWMVGTGSPDVYNDIVINIVPALAAIGVSAIDVELWWQGEQDRATDINYLADFETVQARLKGNSWFPPATPVIVCAIASSLDGNDATRDPMNDVLEACVASDADNRKFFYPSDFSGSTYWQQPGTDGYGHMTAAGYDAAGSAAARLFLAGNVRARVTASAVDAWAREPLNVNGSHEISQINVGNAVTIGSLNLLTDCWKGLSIGPAMTAQRVAAPFSTRPEIAYGLKINTGTAKSSLSSGDVVALFHRMEGVRVKGLAFGNSIARPVALGIWLKSSINLVLYLALRNAVPDRCFSRRVSLTAGVEAFVTLTYPGCRDGTWASDNGLGLEFAMTLAAGSSIAVGTADIWQTGTTAIPASDQGNLAAATNNNIIISNLIMVPGLYLPSQDHSVIAVRNTVEEWRACRRYIEKSYDKETAVGTASVFNGVVFANTSATVGSGRAYLQIPLQVPKRSNAYTGTVYSYNGAAGKVSDGTLADLAANSGNFGGNSGENSFLLINNSGGAVTPGATSIFAHWVIDNSL